MMNIESMHYIDIFIVILMLPPQEYHTLLWSNKTLVHWLLTTLFFATAASQTEILYKCQMQ